MKSINRLFYSKHSSLVLSILFGVSVVCILFACSDETCVSSYVGPKVSEMNKIFRSGDKCVKYVEKSVECDKNKKKLSFA